MIYLSNSNSFFSLTSSPTRIFVARRLDLLSDQVLHKLSSPMATFAYHLGQKLSYCESEIF